LGPEIRTGRRRRKREVQPELIREFLAPLSREGGRNKDQHPPDHPPENEFPQKQAGFYGLSKAHFVREKHAATEMAKHFSDGFDLVRKVFDAA
jgi:hypothetical protein